MFKSELFSINAFTTGIVKITSPKAEKRIISTLKNSLFYKVLGLNLRHCTFSFDDRL